jgi:hypothetical protein
MQVWLQDGDITCALATGYIYIFVMQFTIITLKLQNSDSVVVQIRILNSLHKNQSIQSKTNKNSKSNLYYDRHSVGQSVLCQAPIWDPTTNFSPFFNYFKTVNGFVDVGRPLSVVQ